jgi:hypothetical protein
MKYAAASHNMPVYASPRSVPAVYSIPMQPWPCFASPYRAVQTSYTAGTALRINGKAYFTEQRRLCRAMMKLRSSERRNTSRRAADPAGRTDTEYE